MDAMAGGDIDTGVAKNVTYQTGTDATGDVIFLPTDAAGTPGQLNSEVLSKLGLPTSMIPKRTESLAGYAIKEAGPHQVCFVVTVGEIKTEELLKQNLTAALIDSRLAHASVMWFPLMGTGAGGLRLEISLDITMAALRDTGWLARTGVEIIVARPPNALSAADPQRESTPANDPESEVDVKPPADETTKDIPLSDGVGGALEFAAALREGSRKHRDPISTSLLFFALAESQMDRAPRSLAKDRAASLFSGAVHALAGRRFRDAWNRYFSPVEDKGVLGFLPPLLASGHTTNVGIVLNQAARNARNLKHHSVEVDDLIISLLSLPSGHYKDSLETMGVSMSELLQEYRDALTGQIGKNLLNDVAAESDQLGYDSYADAIRDFLTDAATPPPLSISIQAPWGAGKSSLMRQIRNKLDPREAREKYKFRESANQRDRLKLSDVLAFLDQKQGIETHEISSKGLWTVWFNAWKYDTSQQVWAGLVDSIVSQISARLRPIDRELFLLRLQLARIDDGIVRRKIYDRVVTIWWAKARAWVLAGAVVIASVFGVHKAAEPLIDPALIKLIAWSQLAPIVVLALYLVKSYFASRERTQAEPASFSLAEYLSVPDYTQTLGTIHHIHEDLIRVLSLTPRHANEPPAPIVIFIDDLDRCSPSKVASVVEGVSMFLASEDYRCMFVIGMDPQMIAAALEEAHAKVREQLPRYERTVPLGWRFMDKFIQLPFTIPPSNADALKSYVNWLSGATPIDSTQEIPPDVVPSSMVIPHAPTPPPEDSQDGSPIARQPRDDQKGDTSATVRTFKESRDVGAIIREAANSTSGNPREIKRLANIARLYLGLRNSRRLRDPSWRSPNISQYARWIVVTLRWPDMMRWLLWGADEATWNAERSVVKLPVRRLQFLESEASSAQTPEAWTVALVKILKVPGSKESDWPATQSCLSFSTLKCRWLRMSGSPMRLRLISTRLWLFHSLDCLPVSLAPIVRLAPAWRGEARRLSVPAHVQANAESEPTTISILARLGTWPCGDSASTPVARARV
jgi:hypothetical protein